MNNLSCGPTWFVAILLSIGSPEGRAACQGPLQAGDDCEFTIRADGRDRNYLLHVPSGYDGAPVPLVVDIHGFTGTPEVQRAISGMFEVSNAENFAVAYPRGGIAAPPEQTAGFQRGFNGSAANVVPGCCGTPAAENWDDTAFILEVKRDVARRMSIDRVHVTGLSNGSWMGHRLLCQAPEEFDSFALTAAGLSDSWDDCQPSVARPLIYMHGRNDTVVPIEGAPDIAGEFMLSAAETVAIYAGRNRCSGHPEAFVTTHVSGSSFCREYAGCDQRLAYCELDAPHVTYNATPLALAEIFWAFLGQERPASPAPLDFDGDGRVGALTDGLLLLRYLYGFDGEALTTGAVGDDAVRTRREVVVDALDLFVAQGLVDVDGDGTVNALTDGVLIVRRLFGFGGAALVAEATGPNASRADAQALADHIDGLTEAGNREDSSPSGD